MSRMDARGGCYLKMQGVIFIKMLRSEMDQSGISIALANISLS